MALKPTLAPISLLFLTPSARGTDFFAHLVEHCVLASINCWYDHFFGVAQTVSGTLKHNMYSEFDLPYYVNYKQLLEQIVQDLSPSIIRKEMKVLRTECDGTRSRIEALADAISAHVWQKIITNRRITCTYDEVIAYHRKWYQQGKRILMDVYANRLKTTLTKVYRGGLNLSKTTIWSGQFLGKGHKYNVIYTPTRNLANFAVFWLLEHICTDRKLYHYRYKQLQYYYDETDLSYVHGHMYLANPYQGACDFDEEFFNQAKHHFLEHKRLDGGKNFLRAREIINQQLLDDLQIKTFLQTITYQQIKSLQALLAPKKK